MVSTLPGTNERQAEDESRLQPLASTGGRNDASNVNTASKCVELENPSSLHNVQHDQPRPMWEKHPYTIAALKAVRKLVKQHEFVYTYLNLRGTKQIGGFKLRFSQQGITSWALPKPSSVTNQSEVASLVREIDGKIFVNMPPSIEAAYKSIHELAEQYNHEVRYIHDEQTVQVIGIRLWISPLEWDTYTAESQQSNQESLSVLSGQNMGSAQSPTRLEVQSGNEQIPPPLAEKCILRPGGKAQSDRVERVAHGVKPDCEDKAATQMPPTVFVSSTSIVSEMKGAKKIGTSRFEHPIQTAGKSDLNTTSRSTTEIPTITRRVKAQPKLSDLWPSDRKELRLWNGKTQATPLRIKQAVEKYGKETKVFLRWARRTLERDTVDGIQWRLSPEVCSRAKWGNVTLDDAMFRYLDDIIKAREDVGVWHDHVMLAAIKGEIPAEDEDCHYDSIHSFEKSNKGHKQFVSELKARQTTLLAYAARRAVEKAAVEATKEVTEEEMKKATEEVVEQGIRQATVKTIQRVDLQVAKAE